MKKVRYYDPEMDQVMRSLRAQGFRHWREKDLRQHAELILGRPSRTEGETRSILHDQKEKAGQGAEGISTWLSRNATTGYLYVGTITLPNGPTYTKLGISKSPTTRIRDHERNGFRITHRWEVPTYATAQAIEREALEWARDVSGFDARRDADWLDCVMPQGGYTELTTLEPDVVAGAVEELIQRHKPRSS